MKNLENTLISFSTVNDNNVISLLLCDNDKFDDTNNRKVSIPTTRFIKVGLQLSKIVGFICFNESRLKMMKNTVYFKLKAIFVLDMFKFLF